MNSKYLAVVAALAVMVVAATAVATTDSAFAGKKGKNTTKRLLKSMIAAMATPQQMYSVRI